MNIHGARRERVVYRQRGATVAETAFRLCASVSLWLKYCEEYEPQDTEAQRIPSRRRLLRQSRSDVDCSGHEQADTDPVANDYSRD
jgi:hypothetical protein